MVAYLGYWQVRRGDAMFPLDVQRTSWGHEPWWPWRTLVEGARQGTRGVAAYPAGLHQVEFLLVAIILVLTVWVVWRAPRSYAVWTVASLLLPLSTPIPSRVLLSVPRYALVVFPLAWGAAVLSERFKAHTLVIAVSSGLLALLTVLHTLGYPFF
jgi:hypothetical protein